MSMKNTHTKQTMKFTINGKPANDILTPIVLELKEKTIEEIMTLINHYYPEDWYFTTTPSLTGNDNRLRHRIRTIRAQYGLTY